MGILYLRVASCFMLIACLHDAIAIGTCDCSDVMVLQRKHIWVLEVIWAMAS